ncbi:hypothetical protein AC578_2138 [Pseudocercospora eumusae]|uniref:Methyltransferase domain-containing protein n=1 Tax=Pseudocercospora eumusae TaxID=321146 RepID=A0A139HQE1_9PEZI|nr:hypothetical protein AC578_2138 [Pseudocercospora eumusae]
MGGDMDLSQAQDASPHQEEIECDVGHFGKDGYWLRRGGIESQRVGYLLHPDIEESLKPNARIADMGTGTGIVVLDLASRLPATMSFDGFDLSPDQYSQNLPANVSLKVLDAKATPPPEVRNRYDVIHLRYLNSAMNEKDWDIVTDNVFGMLKPGGWVQWLEADFGGARWLRNEPRTKAQVHEELHSIMRPQIKHWSFAARELEEILMNRGFQDVRQEVTSTDRIPDMRRAWSMVEIGAMTSFFPNLKHDLSPEQCTEKINQLKEEAQNDVYVRWNLHVWLGRKPLPN